MGKRIIAQRKGRGTHTYKAPSHRYKAEVGYPSNKEKVCGTVTDIINDPVRNSPLMEIVLNGKKEHLIASHGIAVGDKIEIGNASKIRQGNVVPLGEIPEGTQVFNIEVTPYDGGKLVRSSGGYATVISRSADKIVISLPSKQLKSLNPKCRATIGASAGGERKIKPFGKAGAKHHLMRARGRLYPLTSAGAMNAVDHKFGGSNLGVPKTSSRNAPPGRKVGSFAAKKTGKKR